MKTLIETIQLRTFEAKMFALRFRDEIKGVAAIEFAILAPLMLLMYIGTIEISMAVSINRKLARATGTIGDLVTRADTEAACMTNAQVSAIMNLADDLLYPYDTSDPEVMLANISIDQDGKKKVVWSRAISGAQAPAKGSAYEVPPQLTRRGTFLIASKVDLRYQPIIGWFSLSNKRSISKDTSAIEMSEELFFRSRLNDQVTLCTP